MTEPTEPRDLPEPPEGKTYVDPGDCVKCEAPGRSVTGTVRHRLDWETMYYDGRGVLNAICWRCSFKWRVLAKDEIDKHRDSATLGETATVEKEVIEAPVVIVFADCEVETIARTMQMQEIDGHGIVPTSEVTLIVKPGPAFDYRLNEHIRGRYNGDPCHWVVTNVGETRVHLARRS